MGDKTRFVFWDVQHGSATYIRTPADKHVAVDLGTGSYTSFGENFSPLNHLKHKWQVAQLNGLVVTHPHRDHLDDVFSLADVQPEYLRAPFHLSDTEVRDGNRAEDLEAVEEYLSFIKGYGRSNTPAQSPFLAQNNGDVHFDFFVPRGCPRSNLNNHSIVTVVSYAGSKAILTGDNEDSSWAELLDDPSFLTAIDGADLLLASHHGRKSGFYAPIFEYFAPLITVISDGDSRETSVTSRYDQKTRGYQVLRRSTQEYASRKCVSTRNDGCVVVDFSRDDSGRSCMDVWID